MNGKIFFYMGFLLFVVFLTLGSSLRNQDLGNYSTIEEYTNAHLNWNSSYFELESLEENTTISITSIRTKNIVYKYADFVGYSFFELGKIGIEYGYHSNYESNDAESIVLWTKAFVGVILFVTIFPILIPLCALVYLIYNFIKNRSERVRKAKED